MDEPNTKEGITSLLFNYLGPLKRVFSNIDTLSSFCHMGTTYDDAAMRLELFARPLWGLVPFWAGGGRDSEFEDIYRRGLSSGVNPDSPGYWGRCHSVDQRFVEMAAIAYGLLLVPEILWDPLDDQDKKNLIAWLEQIDFHRTGYNNWFFFPPLVNLAFRKLGLPSHRSVSQACLAAIDELYAGGGWYTDGISFGRAAMKDYYNAFAFHFYGVLYSSFAHEYDATRCSSFIERAYRFSEDYVKLFSPNGESVPFGRSMTYRFAQSSFFSMCAARKVDVLPVGTLKGIVMRSLKAWSRLPITDSSGLLTIGYHYPCTHMSESYNGPGSPYWAMKAFSCLSLPDTDPFWNTEQRELPAHEGVSLIANGEMLVQRRDEEVILYPSGHTGDHLYDHMEEKYSKFAYSSTYGFSVARSNCTVREAAPDSMLAFVINGYVFVRRSTLRSASTKSSITSRWSPWPGIEVISLIIPTGSGHRREHLISSSVECVAYDCGFAVPADEKPERVQILAGRGRIISITPDPNTNLMAPRTRITAAKYKVRKGEMRIVTEFSRENDG